jgi:hypothetical protein
MPSRLTTIAVASAAGLAALSVTLVGIPALADTATGQSPTDAVSKRVAAIRGSLQGLVDDKTLTDAQADKVADTLGKKGLGPGGRPDGPGGFGRHGGFGFGAGLDPVAKLLGMSTDDVRTALRNGTTLADLAEQHGKSTDDVVTTMVKPLTDRIDQAVKNGKLTKAQGVAAEKKATDAVRTFVTQGFKGLAPGREGFGKFGGPGFPRHHGDDGDGDGEGTPTPSPSASASTSSFSA